MLSRFSGCLAPSKSDVTIADASSFGFVTEEGARDAASTARGALEELGGAPATPTADFDYDRECTNDAVLIATVYDYFLFVDCVCVAYSVKCSISQSVITVTHNHANDKNRPDGDRPGLSIVIELDRRVYCCGAIGRKQSENGKRNGKAAERCIGPAELPGCPQPFFST
jgi:hypothetical protein